MGKYLTPTLPEGLGDEKDLISIPIYQGQPSLAACAGVFLRQVFVLLLLVPLFLLLLPFSLLGRAAFGRDPTAPRLSHIFKLVGLALFDKDMVQPMSFGARIRTALGLVTIALRCHSLWAVCWYIDELLGLCGGWKSAEIIDPVFLISNARTGSTELGVKMYEVGNHLLAPCSLQVVMPYIWVWKIARAVCCLDRGKLVANMHEHMERNSPEFFKRHKGHPFKPDTFEVLVCMTTMALGPMNMMVGANAPPYGVYPETEEDDVEHFCRFVDSIFKKVLHFNGRPQQRRPYIKGHFIHAAPRLYQKYPSAVFATVVRPIDKMFQSQANFLHVQPFNKAMAVSCPPWPWVRNIFLKYNIDYCQREMDFYLEDVPDSKRIVIQFEDYVKDLPGSIRKILEEGRGLTVTEEEIEMATGSKLTTIKGAKESYEVNVSCNDLGISQEWFEKAFAKWNAALRSPPALGP